MVRRSFSALLLKELPQNEYKRVASFCHILARSTDSAGVSKGKVNPLTSVSDVRIMKSFADAVHISGVGPQVISFKGLVSSNVLFDMFKHVFDSVPRGVLVIPATRLP